MHDRNHTPGFYPPFGRCVARELAPGFCVCGELESPDVCVYGATASGIMAAVAAAREGSRVLIIEPSRWLGGMTGGGLMQLTGGASKRSAGTTRGILKRGYNDPQYRAAFAALLKEHAIPVIFEHRVASVQREGARIQSITLDHAPPDRFGCPVAQAKTRAARRVAARVFIDCSYEGDLMAQAGVSYTLRPRGARQLRRIARGCAAEPGGL